MHQKKNKLGHYGKVHLFIKHFYILGEWVNGSLDSGEMSRIATTMNVTVQK